MANGVEQVDQEMLSAIKRNAGLGIAIGIVIAIAGVFAAIIRTSPNVAVSTAPCRQARVILLVLLKTLDAPAATTPPLTAGLPRR